MAYAKHEVRTCLHVIAGLAAMVEVDSRSGANREAVYAIQLAVADADRILGDMVLSPDLGPLRGPTVRWVIESRPWAPQVELPSWVSVWRSLVAEQGTRIHVHVADGVPGVVMGDAPHLRQILSALVANAIKFAAGGTIRVHAWADRTATGSVRLAIEVSDDGIGIEADALDRIFEPHQQASPAVHERFGGSGMGLAVSRELARALGGDIEVRSRPGHGAAFRVTVPLVSVPDIGLEAGDLSRGTAGALHQRRVDLTSAGPAASSRGAGHGLQLVSRLFREASGPGGVRASPIDLEILGAVMRERDKGRRPSLKSVQANLCRAKTVVKYHVDQLVEKQLLDVSTDENDRRRSVFVLTDRAEALIAAFEKVVQERVAQYHAAVAQSDLG
jgi:DNA-binding MarR family transcriptional regulator/anti-sigma regulatory factor (Ser/Thr protein kinase)